MGERLGRRVRRVGKRHLQYPLWENVEGGARMSQGAHHLDTVAAKFRGAHRLLSALNEKTPKAEKVGILSAILYLAPATMASPKTVCPYSTAACREGCLFSAGRGRTPRVINARMRRTLMYLNERDQFFDELVGEL